MSIRIQGRMEGHKAYNESKDDTNSYLLYQLGMEIERSNRQEDDIRQV